MGVKGHSDHRGGCARTSQLSDGSRLSLIKSRVLQELYSPQSFCRSAAEILQNIRELDAELEVWRMSTPAGPMLDLYAWHGENHIRTVENMTTIANVELVLDYYFLMQAIHCASSRPAFRETMSHPEVWYGVESSLKISLQACRSIIVCLLRTATHFSPDILW